MPTFISDTELEVLLPNSLLSGVFDIFVSNNGQDFTKSSSNVFINYYDNFGITGFSLKKFSIGSSVDLTITGYGFPDPTKGLDFWCVVGDTAVAPNVEYFIEAQ